MVDLDHVNIKNNLVISTYGAKYSIINKKIIYNIKNVFISLYNIYII